MQFLNYFSSKLTTRRRFCCFPPYQLLGGCSAAKSSSPLPNGNVAVSVNQHHCVDYFCKWLVTLTAYMQVPWMVYNIDELYMAIDILTSFQLIYVTMLVFHSIWSSIFLGLTEFMFTGHVLSWCILHLLAPFFFYLSIIYHHYIACSLKWWMDKAFHALGYISLDL